MPHELTLLIPDLHLLTSFAHDHGDMLHKVQFRGQEYPPHEATRRVLTAVGWADRKDKVKLGEAWVREIVLFGLEVVEGKQLQAVSPAPTSELLEDGTYRFTALVVSMRGRQPSRDHYFYKVEISPNAELKTDIRNLSAERRIPRGTP